jgi:two-component system response regulator DesR
MSTIVMADDHPIYLEMMKALLEYSGEHHVVSMCSNGHAALAHAYARCPDLVIADIDMPGVDGIELTRRLRGGGFDQPILIVSAGAMPIAAQRARAAGATGFVHKRVLLRELTVAARIVLSGDFYFPAEATRYGGRPRNVEARREGEPGARP